jgi:hypothetical protein
MLFTTLPAPNEKSKDKLQISKAMRYSQLVNNYTLVKEIPRQKVIYPYKIPIFTNYFSK